MVNVNGGDLARVHFGGVEVAAEGRVDPVEFDDVLDYIDDVVHGYSGSEDAIEPEELHDNIEAARKDYRIVSNRKTPELWNKITEKMSKHNGASLTGLLVTAAIGGALIATAVLTGGVSLIAIGVVGALIAATSIAGLGLHLWRMKKIAFADQIIKNIKAEEYMSSREIQSLRKLLLNEVKVERISYQKSHKNGHQQSVLSLARNVKYKGLISPEEYRRLRRACHDGSGDEVLETLEAIADSRRRDEMISEDQLIRLKKMLKNKEDTNFLRYLEMKSELDDPDFSEILSQDDRELLDDLFEFEIRHHQDQQIRWAYSVFKANKSRVEIYKWISSLKEQYPNEFANEKISEVIAEMIVYLKEGNEVEFSEKFREFLLQFPKLLKGQEDVPVKILCDAFYRFHLYRSRGSGFSQAERFLKPMSLYGSYAEKLEKMEDLLSGINGEDLDEDQIGELKDKLETLYGVYGKLIDEHLARDVKHPVLSAEFYGRFNQAFTKINDMYDKIAHEIIGEDHQHVTCGCHYTYEGKELEANKSRWSEWPSGLNQVLDVRNGAGTDGPHDAEKKKIWCLSIGTGSGHNSAAAAVGEMLGDDYHFDIVDLERSVLSQVDPLYVATNGRVDFTNKFNEFVLNQDWDTMEHLGQLVETTYRSREKVKSVEMALMRESLLRHKPDMIITCIGTRNHRLTDIAREFQIPILCVNTDLEAHGASWPFRGNPTSYPGFKMTIAYDDPAIRKSYRYGHDTRLQNVRDDQAIATGHPVRTAFLSEVPDAQEISEMRDDEGIAENEKVLMVMGGGLGLGGAKMANSIIENESLASPDQPVRMNVICARNVSWRIELMQKEIRRLQRISDDRDLTREEETRLEQFRTDLKSVIDGEIQQIEANQQLTKTMQERVQEYHSVRLILEQGELLEDDPDEEINPYVTIQPYGYVSGADEMVRLMDIADVLFTKPGGSTVNEALARDLPMVFDNTSQNALSWEIFSMEWVEEHKMGKKLDDIEDVEEVLTELFPRKEEVRVQREALAAGEEGDFDLLPQADVRENFRTAVRDLLDLGAINMDSIYAQHELDDEDPELRDRIDAELAAGAVIPNTMEVFQDGKKPDLGGFRALSSDSQAVVLVHERIPGVVFKATQEIHRGTFRDNNLYRVPESRAIQQFVDDRELQHIVVPKKSLYLLPDRREHKGQYTTDNYIVVAEMMDLIPQEENLDRLYNMTEEEIDEVLEVCFARGFHDIAWVSRDGKLLGDADPNLRFTRDGKIAFIDTEVRTTDMHNWDPSVGESKRRRLNRRLAEKSTSRALKYFVRPEMHKYIDQQIAKLKKGEVLAAPVDEADEE